MELSELLAYAGAGIGGSFGVLQTARTLSTRTTEGVSMLSWATMAANAGFWFMYGVSIGSTQQMLGNFPWIVMSLVLGWFLANDRRLPRRVAVGWPVLALALGAATMSVSSLLMAPVGLSFGLLIAVPQIRIARRSGHAVGVSLWAWAASTVAGVCWAGYGILERDVPVVVTSLPSLICNAVLTALIFNQRRARDVLPAPNPSTSY